MLVAGLALAPAAADAACRQALALGLDVSGSVDATEFRLQLDGLAAALTSDEVAAALLAQPEAPVRLAVYDWSGPRDQRMLLPWTEIGEPADLADVATRLRAARRHVAAPTTALGAAMRRGFDLLDQQAACWRRTLDISGDGISNAGPRPQDIGPAPGGLTVNALVIGAPGAPGAADGLGALTGYFQAYVLRGPDAFIVTAAGFEDYQAAMQHKLLRELRALAIGAADVPGGGPG